MMFGRKKAPSPEPEPELPELTADPAVLELLGRLEKTGAQVLVKPYGGAETFTSSVIGLGRDGFFIDTLSPPEGDLRLRSGRLVGVEILFQGLLYRFDATLLAKVRFLDELPAFKLTYPESLRGERRRRSPRVDTRGDASLSFLRPFACDAPVVNLSEGGLAFEYGAELGTLRPGVLLRDILLELGTRPVIAIHGRVVAQVVTELGGLGLPRRYRTSIAFQGLSPREVETVLDYLQEAAPKGILA